MLVEVTWEAVTKFRSNLLPLLPETCSHHSSTVCVPALPIDLRVLSKVPRVLEFDVTADWHRRDRSAFRCFNRKLTGLNHFSVNNKNNKIISEFSPFNFEFWNFFLTSVESVFILTAELWGHGQGATDGALWYPPLGLWQWICLKDPRTWLAL